MNLSIVISTINYIYNLCHNGSIIFYYNSLFLRLIW
nr:MAG TPA: hypothetical protein [Caudoviricetes sp.]